MKMRFTFSLLFVLFSFSTLAQWQEQQSFHPIAKKIKQALPADINGDGYMDVVALSRDPKRLYWQASTADHMNFSLVKIIAEAEAFYAFDLGDIDQDGDVDIVAAVDFPTRIVWYENIGNVEAQFKEQQILLEAEFIDNLQLYDFNQDGLLDISYSGYTEINREARFGVLLNQENASFSAPIRAEVSFRLGLVDPYEWFFFEGSNNQLEIYGNWRFGIDLPVGVIYFDRASSTFSSLNVISEEEDVITNVTDIDKDNAPELIVNDPSRGVYLYTLKNNQWLKQPIYPSPLPSFRTAITDINRDGFLDVVMSMDSFSVEQNRLLEERLFWTAGNADLNFADPLALTSQVPRNAHLLFKDFNGDETSDLFYYLDDDVAPSYKIRQADGDWNKAIPFSIGFLPSSFVIGDADGDGDNDLFCTDARNQVFFSFRNQSNQGFNSIYLEQADIQIDGKLSGGDFNQDGQFDLLHSEFSRVPDGELVWLERTNTGWQSHIIESQQYYQPFLFPKDIDQDGDLDIVASSGVNAVTFYRNQGDGTFAEREIVGTDFSYLDMKLVDWNNDNRLDVIARVQNFDAKLILHTWNGNGFDDLVELVNVSNSRSFLSFAPFDFNQDSLIDIIGADAVENIKVLYHETPLDFNGEFIFDAPRGSEIHQFYARDINGDQEQDLFFFYTSPEQVSEVAWMKERGDISSIVWEFLPLDSAGVVLPIQVENIRGKLPDLIAYHEKDQTYRWYINTFDMTSSTTNWEKNSSLTLYPNPTNENVYLKMNDFTNYQGVPIKIVNGLGQIVLQTQFLHNNLAISTEDWSNGIYFVFIGNEEKVVKKLQVTK